MKIEDYISMQTFIKVSLLNPVDQTTKDLIINGSIRTDFPYRHLMFQEMKVLAQYIPKRYCNVSKTGMGARSIKIFLHSFEILGIWDIWELYEWDNKVHQGTILSKFINTTGLSDHQYNLFCNFMVTQGLPPIGTKLSKIETDFIHLLKK